MAQSGTLLRLGPDSSHSPVNLSPKLRASENPHKYLSINNIPVRFTAIFCGASVRPSRRTRWSLDGMTALVTGGTRGIGHAIVEGLVGLGAIVHACAPNETELNRCLRDWEEEGFGVTGSVFDVSARAQREELLDPVSSVFDVKLNILINNVETNIRKLMVDFTAEELGHPLLKASGAGNVVFTSSVSGFVSLKSMSVHGARKGNR